MMADTRTGIMMRAVICVLIGITGEAYSTDARGGVFFEEQGDTIITNSHWTIIFNYSMGGFHNNIREIDAQIRALDDDYGRYEHLFPGFRMEAERIRQSLAKFVKTSDFFMSLFPKYRQRRGLFNIVGTGMSYVFGVATTDQLDEINGKLEYLNGLDTSNLHVTDQHLSVISKMEEQVSGNTDKLKILVAQFINATQLIQETITAEENNKIYQTLTMHFRQIELIMNDATINLQALQHTLQMAALGSLSHGLVPPERLLQVLTDVQKALPQGYTLREEPTPENLHTFYRHARVFAAINGLHLYVHVNFLIHSQDNIFRTWKAHSYPIHDNTTGLWTQYQLTDTILLMSRDGNYYTTYTTEIFDKCIAEETTYCLRDVILTHITQGNCLTDLARNHTTNCNRVITFPQTAPVLFRIRNDLVFSTDTRRTIQVTCPQTVTHVEINGHGTLPVDARCTITTEKQKILPRLDGRTWRNGNLKYLRVPTIATPIMTESERNIARTDVNQTLEALMALQQDLARDNSTIKITRLIEKIKEQQESRIGKFAFPIVTATGSSTLITILLLILLYFAFRR